MITIRDSFFHLQTQHTSYGFRVTKTGHLEHLCYGKRVAAGSEEVFIEQHAFQPGNVVLYDQGCPEFSLEDMRLEMSSWGKGDIREPFVEIVHADGAMTSDFLYQSYEVTTGTDEMATLPGSYDESGRADHLTLHLTDAWYHLGLDLHYYVYEDCDVITRRAVLVNHGTDRVFVKRLMSTQLDFLEKGLCMTSFHGAHCREMEKSTVTVTGGKYVSESICGTSSSRSNPFVMISRPDTTEEHGACYGCNLIYSGNHYEALEATAYGKSRFVSGINPRGFSYLLNPEESLESPEAVMAYSENGFQGMSRCMHEFVREHIVRGEWKRKARPVLLNSWEAAYFSINEKKLLSLAKDAKALGIELIVLDDGWFGNRRDDTSSLGDWTCNTNKFPHGLKGISDQIHDMGMTFGIWVEPEMVNQNSRLYEAHPDWVMEIPGKHHCEGRNQRILDLSNREVCDYLIKAMSEVFSSARIEYVKWDMNRIFSDIYSQKLPPEQQGEVAHRYVVGLYYCMKTLTERFPQILFEGCAAGGNRFDLGILCYFPQIWASDNTDALCRVRMMTNYSYGYPMSTVSAHVSSCPNHQTLRVTPLATRFAVAAFGLCGYELNVCDLGAEEKKEIARQIAFYKEFRQVLQFGDFYRGRNGNIHEWTVVSPDKKLAIGMIMQELMAAAQQYEKYVAKGLNPEERYHFYSEAAPVDIREYGDLVNTQSPVHVRVGSVLQRVIARFYKLPGEAEDAYAYGDTLMDPGMNLKQAYSATGISDQVRNFPDFASRLYLMAADEGDPLEGQNELEDQDSGEDQKTEMIQR